MVFVSIFDETGPGVSIEGKSGILTGTRSGDSGEVVVTHHVILRADMTSARIQNAGDSGGVSRRKAQIDAMAGPGFPFWKLLFTICVTLGS